jgi:hypothetical protein
MNLLVSPKPTPGIGVPTQLSVRATGPGACRTPTQPSRFQQYFAITYGTATVLFNYAAPGASPTTSSRREALLSRAPSRQRIAALMNRLPPSDEWLDDKYDQEP